MTRIVFEIEMVVEIKTVDFHKFKFSYFFLACWTNRTWYAGNGGARPFMFCLFSLLVTLLPVTLLCSTVCYNLLHFCLLRFCLYSVHFCLLQCNIFYCYSLLHLYLVDFCLLQFFSASLLHLHENLTWVGPIDTHVFIWYFNLNLKQSLL